MGDTAPFLGSTQSDGRDTTSVLGALQSDEESNFCPPGATFSQMGGGHTGTNFPLIHAEDAEIRYK